MAKLEALSSILSKFASITALNSNFTKITTAFDNTLSRDGSSPNAMEANIDMDSNRIINCVNPASNTEPVILGYFELGNMTNIDLTGIQDGDGIVWDAGNSEFIPGSVSVGGGGGGGGTVTSVAVTGSDGIEVDSGSPVTAAGTIALGIDAAALRTHINVAAGATANSSDATLLNRTNHTGTQTASTISDFSTAADARIATASVGDLTDVDLTGLSNGDTLVYNSGSGDFEPGAGGGGGTVTSVAIAGTDGIEVDSGSPIATTGTITLGLSAATQTSLGLADTATQPGDNISTLTNDSGFITATLTQEQVEDFVGDMVTGNTETLINVSYEDSDGTLDFVVDDDLSNYDNTTSGFLDGSSSVTDLSDVSDAGSGEIITAAERTLVNGAVQVLSSATTYFVNKSGSDSNDGLSSGNAFLTIQKAIDTIASFNLGGLTHTISIDDGSAVTYAEALTLLSLTGGSCIIEGDETTPGNIRIAPASGNAFTIVGGTTGRWDIRGVDIDGATTGLFLSGGAVGLANVEFSAATNYHIQATGNSTVIFTDDYEITGGGTAHIYTTTSAVVTCNSRTVTLTGTPNFSRAFAWAQSGSVIRAAANTYSGSATGKRYEITQNAVASTNGAATTYFPGNTAGTTGSGGQYT